jgi:hypothetical protein
LPTTRRRSRYLRIHHHHRPHLRPDFP